MSESTTKANEWEQPEWLCKFYGRSKITELDEENFRRDFLHNIYPNGNDLFCKHLILPLIHPKLAYHILHMNFARGSCEHWMRIAKYILPKLVARDFRINSSKRYKPLKIGETLFISIAEAFCMLRLFYEARLYFLHQNSNEEACTLFTQEATALYQEMLDVLNSFKLPPEYLRKIAVKSALMNGQFLAHLPLQVARLVAEKRRTDKMMFPIPTDSSHLTSRSEMWITIPC